MPQISLIVAMARNRVIGHNNAMPWHLGADLKHFKALTMGKPIVMGRKTFEAIGKKLPGRENIIITRNADYKAAGCVVCTSLQAALDHCVDCEEVMVIGGAQIYEQAIPLAERIYLTIINHDYTGDTYFPSLNTAVWQEIDRHDFPAGDEIPFAYSFVTLGRAGAIKEGVA